VSVGRGSPGSRRIIAATGLLALTLAMAACGGESHPAPASLCATLDGFTRGTSPHDAAAALGAVQPPTDMGNGAQVGLRLVIAGLDRLPDSGQKVDLTAVEKGLGPHAKRNVVHFLHYVESVCMGTASGS
jgi:hypothetical protein